MAKKKVEPKKEDPKYMRLCENSNACSVERSEKVLSDMKVTSCTQCFHILSWEKISIDKKSSSTKSKAKNKESIEEAQIVPDIEETVKNVQATKKDTKVDEDAAKLRETFSGIDDIMSEVNIGNAQVATEKEIAPAEVAEIEMDFDPFAEEAPVEVKTEIGFFLIDALTKKADNMLRLVMWNEGKTNKFIVDKETEPAKVTAIVAKPETIVGKYLKAEFTGVDSKGNPVNLVYLALAGKPS